MIYNPMVVHGGEPQWQELVLNGTQDVPIMRAPPPTADFPFELRFDKMPTAILFRTLLDGFEWGYSVVGMHMESYRAFNDRSVGVQDVTVSGTTISGTFTTEDGTAEFLPIYN